MLPAKNGPHSDAVGSEANLDRQARMALELFTRLGFAPALVDARAERSERVIRLTACPVRNLARSHPEAVCSVHLGLLQGLLDGDKVAGRPSGGSSVSARLEPFAEPDVCLARLLTRHPG